jgi:glutamyl-tRNA synthetase
MPRGRFAPSPTGDVHLGTARTALVAWLAARRDGGSFVLRIEDIDQPRVIAGAEERMLDDLRWLGLDWDEGPYRQSERLALYDDALAKLESTGLTYACYCSRADVARASSAPHGPNQAYPGTCRGLTPMQRTLLQGQPSSIRFRAPDRDVCFDDAIHGSVCSRADDFVIRRSDGLHAYQLAVVVDDLAMGIEEVVRGDDLLDSTPRQLLLYEALASPSPKFAHVPLVVGPDGQRLAKRHGNASIRALRERCVAAPEVIGRLAASLGLCRAEDRLMPDDLVAAFSFDKLAREPLVWQGV